MMPGIGRTSSCAANLNEKAKEKAQHTSVCEHFDAAFSFKFARSWMFHTTGSGIGR